MIGCGFMLNNLVFIFPSLQESSPLTSPPSLVSVSQARGEGMDHKPGLLHLV